jgi:hypothetical protein
VIQHNTCSCLSRNKTAEYVPAVTRDNAIIKFADSKLNDTFAFLKNEVHHIVYKKLPLKVYPHSPQRISWSLYKNIQEIHQVKKYGYSIIGTVPTLDALDAEDDLVTVRLLTFEDGAFSGTSNAGARGVPGGVRSLRK